MIVGSFSTVVLAVTAAAGWWAYGEVGKTPGELMDYAERRLQGHNKLEWVALPALAQVRAVLDQPSSKTLLQIPFEVPPLPPLAKEPNRADVAANLSAPPGFSGRVLRVGPFEDIRTIAKAAQLARNGDIVEIQSGEYRGDVASWPQKQLTIRTIGGRVRLLADGKSAEGKATWVLRNGDFHIDNIEFVGSHVADLNGAGIRFEGGTLTITRCLFYGNNNGLLTTGKPDSLSISDSEFAYNGFGDGQSHSLYVGKVRDFKVTGSYFHHANVGHHIKSRAQRNLIAYNRITDESGGRGSYEIDLPNGGIATVLGNIVQQGAEPQNSALISYGAEGLAWPENRLYLASNTLVNDQSYGGTFVRTAPGTQRLISANNLFVGPGKWFDGPVSVESHNDQRATWADFEKAARYDYRLTAMAQDKLIYAAPPVSELVPRKQFTQFGGQDALSGPPRYAGALPR